MPGPTTEVVRYAIAVTGFIAIAMVTKQYLAFTWGPLYFIAVLEVLPRLYRRIRYGRPGPPQPDSVPVTES